MLLSPILSTILWAASHAAHAQPTRPLQSNGTVARGLWVNGEPVTRDYANTGQLGSASPCKPDDDLVECAKKIWQPYKPDPLMLVGTREARVPCYWVPGGRDSWSGYIVAKYKAEVSSCGLSDPVIISKQPTFFCNGGQPCSQKFSFTHSRTNTEQYGFSIGVKIEGGVDLKLLSAKTTLSTNFNAEWIRSTSNATTVERTIGMEPGTVCAATSIQMKLNCQSYIIPIESNVEFYDNGDNFHGSFDIFDSRLRPTGLAELEKFRDAIRNKAWTSLDVGSGGLDNKPWVIEGCMFN